ncbi:hypothetical protein [Caenimonas koreensis]|uniref:hypothetical protein n=1 Tax=Caenimonas koreensis TaxID=367474 RepID=UPI0037848667
MRSLLHLAVLAIALTLSACGGGSEAVVAPQAVAKALKARAKPLAGLSVSTVPAAEQAEQLFAKAEASFPGYFPEHATTAFAGPFAYRYYSTGVYLGVVIEQGTAFEYLGVYVVGDLFGASLASPMYAGQLSQYVTVVDPGTGGGTGTLTVTNATNSARNGTFAPQTARGSSTGTDIDTTGYTQDGLFEMDVLRTDAGAIKHAFVWYFIGENIVFFGCDNGIAELSCAGTVTYDGSLGQLQFNGTTLYAIDFPFPGPATKAASGEVLTISGSVDGK